MNKRTVPVALAALAATLAAGVVSAQADPAEGMAFSPDAVLLGQIEALARTGAAPIAPAAAASAPAAAATVPGGLRVQVTVGRLDPRLRLAPCQRIEPYLPAGLPLWGATRIGLRCTLGTKAWNVSLPIKVAVFAKATVVAEALAAGTVLEAGQLGVAEVDIAAAPGAALPDPAPAVGRTLARNLAAGNTLRQTDLKPRQWFAAGETVRVVAAGPGWQVVTEGQAIGAGVEGQLVRVRTESGRLLNARPIGDRQVELSL